MAKKQHLPAETWRYILDDDKKLDADQQSAWILRPLTQLERADARDNLKRVHTQTDGSRTAVARDHRLSIDLCLTNIVAVENFPAGAATKWPDDRDARIAYLADLDDAYVQELGNEIWTHSTTAGDAIKNS
jgi:hypothetical protein